MWGKEQSLAHTVIDDGGVKEPVKLCSRPDEPCPIVFEGGRGGRPVQMVIEARPVE